MKLISHRGNTNGINKEFENNPNYINQALEQGFDVEIDVWLIDNDFYLGHDSPQYKIDFDYLVNPKFWCHAKNSNALSKLLENKIHCFFHKNDNYTITSQGIIWVYPHNLLHYNSVCVLPENGYYGTLEKCYGICSDYINKYKNG